MENGDVGGAWERREVYKVLVGKPRGKRPFERPRREWEDGMRMDLQPPKLIILMAIKKPNRELNLGSPASYRNAL
jgi:hypothetical protein